MTFIELTYIIGGIILLAASIGLIRFRERENIVYARIHIAGAVDIACIFLVLVIGQPLVALIYLLLMPLSAHAIANAHYHGGGVE
jgi:energy-converting hydrogenase B subunit C